MLVAIKMSGSIVANPLIHTHTHTQTQHSLIYNIREMLTCALET